MSAAMKLKFLLSFSSSLIAWTFVSAGVSRVSSHPISTSSIAHEQEPEVHVQLIGRKRIRRDSSPLSMLNPAAYEYKLKISSVSASAAGDGKGVDTASFLYDARLEPLKLTGSIFGSAFKYTELGVDGAGNPSRKTVTPSRYELDSIESQLYSESDPQKNTLVRLEHGEDGELELNGIINGARIRSRRDTTTGEMKFTIVHTVYKPAPTPGAETTDYVLLPPNDTLTRRAGIPIDKIGFIDTVPELALVLDYQLAKDIGGGRTRKLEYAAVTVNGVNGYYELTNDVISIRCQLVHVVTILDEAQQPFIRKAAMRNVQSEDGGKAYNPDSILNEYQKWAYDHKEDLGQYDIAPLLTGVSFLGVTTGLATTPGACRSDKDGGRSLACPLCRDPGANYQGIQVLAHEICHSMGSSHDGDEAETSGAYELPDATDCPFNYGYLMGYNRTDVGTNPFRLSNCSLISIKAYLVTEAAACLLPPTKLGPETPFSTKRQAGEIGGPRSTNPFSPAAHCQSLASLNLEGRVAYQEPDKQCRLVKCMAVASGEITSAAVVPPRNTPCGDNERKGKCRNGYCIGQGSAVDLNMVCKMATGNADSRFVHEKGPMSVACEGSTVAAWYCLGERQPNGEIKVLEMVNVTVAVGTPCAHNKICFNRKCVHKSRIQDENLECVLQTGKQKAQKVPFEHSNPKCSGRGLINCTYGTEYELIGGTDADLDECTDNLTQAPRRALPEEPDDVLLSMQAQPGTLQHLCAEAAGTGSRVAKPHGDDRNKLCSTLVCISASGKEVPNSNQTPDGTICGPLRRCKSGKCVPCGSGSSGRK